MQQGHLSLLQTHLRHEYNGITNAPLNMHQQRFGKIAFCAVTANEQVKGFGTPPMDYIKVRDCTWRTSSLVSCTL